MVSGADASRRASEGLASACCALETPISKAQLPAAFSKTRSCRRPRPCLGARNPCQARLPAPTLGLSRLFAARAGGERALARTIMSGLGAASCGPQRYLGARARDA